MNNINNIRTKGSIIWALSAFVDLVSFGVPNLEISIVKYARKVDSLNCPLLLCSYINIGFK